MDTMDDEDIPREFICPITQTIMVDPVLSSDGYSYEREAIEAWLRNDETSPMTQRPIRDKSLTSNTTFRNLIKSWGQYKFQIKVKGNQEQLALNQSQNILLQNHIRQQANDITDLQSQVNAFQLSIENKLSSMKKSNTELLNLAATNHHNQTSKVEVNVDKISTKDITSRKSHKPASSKFEDDNFNVQVISNSAVLNISSSAASGQNDRVSSFKKNRQSSSDLLVAPKIVSSSLSYSNPVGKSSHWGVLRTEEHVVEWEERKRRKGLSSELHETKAMQEVSAAAPSVPQVRSQFPPRSTKCISQTEYRIADSSSSSSSIETKQRPTHFGFFNSSVDTTPQFGKPYDPRRVSHPQENKTVAFGRTPTSGLSPIANRFLDSLKNNKFSV